VRRALHTVVLRWSGRRAERTLELEARTTSTRLRWAAPATTVSVSGVHGGAGATTLCLLLAHAVARFGAAPALAVDLAGRGRGGLAVLGGAGGKTTAEATALLAVFEDVGLDRPFGVNDAGVRIVGTHPDGIDELDRRSETLVARLVEAIDCGADDAQLGGLARLAVRDDASWQAVRWDNEQLAEAVARILDQAFARHALVVVDLGMLDSELLARTVAVRSDLHVWVLPDRAHALEIAARRLPLLSFEPSGREAIAVWQVAEASSSATRLSALGDLRGCPVVRMANHGGERVGWPERLLSCLSGVGELCELAR
jgi:cellulose biosynthesis protein BcsQ